MQTKLFRYYILISSYQVYRKWFNSVEYWQDNKWENACQSITHHHTWWELLSVMLSAPLTRVPVNQSWSAPCKSIISSAHLDRISVNQPKNELYLVPWMPINVILLHTLPLQDFSKIHHHNDPTLLMFIMTKYTTWKQQQNTS